MSSHTRSAAAFSSVILRICAYVFLRWIPGHVLPPLIASLAVVYITSFVAAVRTNVPYDVVEDDIDIVTKPIQDDDMINVANGSVSQDESVEELDVEETIVLEEKDPRIFTTLLTGAPSPSSLFWTLTTFVINALLVLMVADAVYRAPYYHQAQDLSFARIGYVSDTTAKILIREPDLTQLPIRLSYRHADRPSSVRSRLADSAWKQAGTVVSLSNDTDYTATLTIAHLTPDTRYQYALSNMPTTHSLQANTDYFVTAPKPGHHSKRFNPSTNTEADTSTPLTFLHTSCLIPNFPYSPLRHPLSIPGFQHLSKWLHTVKPAFLLFLGDFIYVDVPRRHGSDVETYRREYRQVYASPDWPSVQGTYDPEIPASDLHDSYADHAIPWLHVWDDHEVANDYGGEIANSSLGYFPSAFDPYTHYHVAPNPPHHRVSKTSLRHQDSSTGSAYFSFIHGPASFFLLDTRRFRTSPNTADSTMLGATQLADLLSWLSTPPPRGVRFKIIISCVPFTKNWRFNSADTWGGYLTERRTILEAMWNINRINSPFSGTSVVILSGDRHEFAATAFPPPASESHLWPASAAVHEFSTSPLSQFYFPSRTYRQGKGDLEDVCLKYLPEGNSKFGVVEIGESSGSGQGVLKYKLVVDGVERWSHVLVTGAQVEGLGGEVWREGLWS